MDNGKNIKKGFLKRLDTYLLIHKPVIWSSRIHSVLYYGLIFIIILSAIAFVSSDDPRNDINIYSWVVLLSVVSVLAFIFWLIYLLRFNVFKRYGKWGATDSLTTFIFYFLIILVFVSWPFTPLIFQSIRANMAYTTPELVKDVNDMNVKLCQLERDSIDLEFASDTLQLSKTIVGSEQRIERDTLAGHSIYSDSYFYIDSATLKTRLLEADSVKSLNDSVYVIYDCPDYVFVSVYYMQERNGEAMMSSMDLYNSVLKRKQVINENEIKQQLHTLLEKYDNSNGHTDNNLTPVDYRYNNYSMNIGFHEKIRIRYQLSRINSSLSNIAEKKYRWNDRFVQSAVRVAFYVTLFFSLLVFIYRHTSRKTFFLSLLAGIIITILTALLIAINSEENDYVLGWYIFYFAVFGLITTTIFFRRNRDAISGIALNLFLFMMPLVPLIVVSLRYAYLRNLYYPVNNPFIYEKVFRNEQLHYLLSEIAGFVLLLVMIATVIQNAYRKWYALPEQ